MAILGALVDWEVMLDMVVGALVAGVVVTTFFALSIVGASGFGEARREGRGGSAIVYGAMWLISIAAFLGGAALGVFVIVDK